MRLDIRMVSRVIVNLITGEIDVNPITLVRCSEHVHAAREQTNRLAQARVINV